MKYKTQKYVLTHTWNDDIINFERREYGSRQKSDKGTGKRWLGIS